MNLAELRSQLQKRLAEAGVGAFSPADLDAALNRSQNQMAEEYGLLERMGQAVIDAKGHMVMPPDFRGFTHEDIQVGSYPYPMRRMTMAEASLVPENHPYPYGYVWDEGLLVDRGVVGDTPTFTDRPTVQVFPAHTWTGEVHFGYMARPPQMEGDTDAPWAGRWADWHDLISLNAARLLQPEQGPSAAGNAVWHQLLQIRLAEFREHIMRQKATYRMRFVNPRGRGGWTGRAGYYRNNRRTS